MFLSVVVGCQTDSFLSSASSQTFVQDFNPEFIDILWVVDDRSPMYRNRARITSEATKFFERLDAYGAQLGSKYRMGIISTDARSGRAGRLKPDGQPVILTNELGTPAQRSQSFNNIFSQVINLKTSADGKGFQAAVAALDSTFVSDPAIPLIMVYISDSNDVSDLPDGETDGVAYYADEFSRFKNNPELISVYSINYRELESGEAKNQDTNRCATFDRADIDIDPNFVHRYFDLADHFGGDTADLCGSFADLIQIRGLTLRDLPRRFKLNRVPALDSISIEVLRNGEAVAFPPWSFDSATNEIVFETVPPQGTTIIVTFNPA